MIFVGHNLVETAKTPEGRSQEVRVEVINLNSLKKRDVGY